jgi:hypothetical protein
VGHSCPVLSSFTPSLISSFESIMKFKDYHGILKGSCYYKINIAQVAQLLWKCGR